MTHSQIQSWHRLPITLRMNPQSLIQPLQKHLLPLFSLLFLHRCHRPSGLFLEHTTFISTSVSLLLLFCCIAHTLHLSMLYLRPLFTQFSALMSPLHQGVALTTPSKIGSFTLFSDLFLFIAFTNI